MNSPDYIAGYTIESLLGEGGMGQVYLAKDKDREVALKVISPILYNRAPEIAYRFKREIDVCKTFAHANLVKILDGGKDKATGCLFLVMELLAGRSLEEILEFRALAEAEAINLAKDIACAFTYYHPQGLVHRDIKPGNIFIEPDGRTVLLDFGLVLVDERTRLTKTNQIVGTPAVMAIEQLLGECSGPPTDVFQLGVTLFWALTMKSPLDCANILGSSGDESNYKIQNVSLLKTKVSEKFANLILRCLSYHACDRYQSGEELLTALEELNELNGKPDCEDEGAEPKEAESLPLPKVETVEAAKAVSHRFALLLGFLLLVILLVCSPHKAKQREEKGRTAAKPGTIIGSAKIYPWRGGVDIDWSSTPNGGGAIVIDGKRFAPQTVRRNGKLINCSFRWYDKSAKKLRAKVVTNFDEQAIEFTPCERLVLPNDWDERTVFRYHKLFEVFKRLTPARQKKLKSQAKWWFKKVIDSSGREPKPTLSSNIVQAGERLVIGDSTGEVFCYQMFQDEDFSKEGSFWRRGTLELVGQYSPPILNVDGFSLLDKFQGRLFVGLSTRPLTNVKESVSKNNALSQLFEAKCSQLLPTIYSSEQILQNSDLLVQLPLPPQKKERWSVLSSEKKNLPMTMTFLPNGKDENWMYVLNHHLPGAIGKAELTKLDVKASLTNKEPKEMMLGRVTFAPQSFKGYIFVNSTPHRDDRNPQHKFLIFSPEEPQKKLELSTKSTLRYSSIFLDRRRELVTFSDEKTIYCLNAKKRKAELDKGPVKLRSSYEFEANEFRLSLTKIKNTLGENELNYSSFLTTPILLQPKGDGTERILTVIASRPMKTQGGFNRFDDLQGLAFLVIIHYKDGSLKIRKLSKMLTIDGGFSHLRHLFVADKTQDIVVFTLSENMWVIDRRKYNKPVILHHRPGQAINRAAISKNHIYYGTKNSPLFCIAFSPLHL